MDTIFTHILGEFMTRQSYTVLSTTVKITFKTSTKSVIEPMEIKTSGTQFIIYNFL